MAIHTMLQRLTTGRNRKLGSTTMIYFNTQGSRRGCVALLTFCLSALGMQSVQAQETEAAASADSSSEATDTPFYNGTYLSPMVTGVFNTNKTPLDDGVGGTLGIGYRSGYYGFEIAPTYADLGNAKQIGAAINALLYPFKSVPNFYATAGLSGVLYKDYETSNGDKKDFNTPNIDAGLGYLFQLSAGRYDYGIRAEARYRVGRREQDYNDRDIDLDAPKRFRQAVVNIGLYLPLGLRPVPPPPPPAPVVVPAPPACSDGVDNDMDGVIDFPADKGCSAADDNDEVNPCKAPEPGERISLGGCGTGDVIVLRGVNFEFDKAVLTVNAKTILDNVAEELTVYPSINVELDGHTDARGSDEYNQDLSERRAQSVSAYLQEKGIGGDRLTAVGFGESQPVADNETDEGRELNRRVELKVTSGTATAQPAAATPATEPAASPEATMAPAAPAETAPPASEPPPAEAPAEAPVTSP